MYVLLNWDSAEVGWATAACGDERPTCDSGRLSITSLLVENRIINFQRVISAPNSGAVNVSS